MKNTKRTSVVNRISTHVAIALVVAILFLTVINLIYMVTNFVREQKIKLDLATNMISSQVEDFTLDMMTVTEDMAGSLTALGALDEVTVRGVIDRVALNHPEYFYVYFADKLGNITMARGVQFAAGVDPRERPWYKAAESVGHSVVIDPYISATSPDVMMVTVATPVYWGSLFVGVVAVDADIQSVRDFMNSIDFEKGAYGFIVDSKDNIIVHPYEDYNPTPDALTNVNDVMPELKQAVDSAESDLVTLKDYKNEDMVFSTVKLDQSQWKVVVAYPQKTIMQHVNRGIAVSVLIAIVTLLIGIIDIRIVVRKMLAPIQKIVPAMEGIIRGDFSTKIAFANADDEIGDLQNTMAMLIADLRDIINAEKHVLNEMEQGNLAVEDIDELPGELNEISKAVNSIKERFNDIIADIQFSAINLQSYAMGINETENMDEMKMIFEELSAEANALMDKTSHFITK